MTTGTMKKLVSLLLAALTLLAALPALAEDGYPVTITTYTYDKEPIEVTFEKAPERVIVAYQDNIEIMLRLGLADRIVCAFGLDEPITGDLKEAFDTIPYQDTRPSKEEAIALDPDLILGWRSLYKDDRFGAVDFWIDRGTNTYMALDSGGNLTQNPDGQVIENEMQDILNIGAMFGKTAEAQAIVDEMYAEIEKVQNYMTEQAIDPIGIAILEDEGDSYRVYGTTTIGGNIAEAVGAVLAVGGEDSNNIGAEDLITIDPDKIFMIWYEGWLGPDDVVAQIMDNPALASLKAVKNGDVYPLNLVQVYCPGLHMMEAIQTFGAGLYPELYAAED